MAVFPSTLKETESIAAAIARQIGITNLNLSYHTAGETLILRQTTAFQLVDRAIAVSSVNLLPNQPERRVGKRGIRLGSKKAEADFD